MKKEIVHSRTDNFEAHAQQAEGGVEFWLARDIQHLVDYSGWSNFNMAITKAKMACQVTGHTPGDHFVDVNKMVDHRAMNLISQDSFMSDIDFQCLTADNSKYIRPLAVRPLTYSEGVPTPWGFSISVADFGLAGGSCHV